MTEVLCVIAVVAIGYLLGSFNFAIIISKRLPKGDIRQHGSGNAGATNMLRNNGKVPALLTALGDSAKCAASVVLGGLIFQSNLGGMIAGLFCLIGHCYPIYFGFKGGKGVITSAIVGLMIFPIPTLIALVVFAAIFVLTKYVSLGSCLALLTFAVVNIFFNLDNIYAIIWGFVMAAFVIFGHRTNIARLIKGTESKMNY